MSVEMHTVVPVQQRKGEDEGDKRLLDIAFDEASSFIRQFSWCKGVKEAYFGLGVGGVVAAFLFRIVPIDKNDEWLWVIIGDLPSAYLVTDEASNPSAALRVYCKMMEEWIQSVRDGKSLDDVFPVNVPPTNQNADLLAKRIALLRDEILPSIEV
jgi:hypothetical protein